MILYHGTWEDNMENILEDGYVYNYHEISECTKMIDNIFLELNKSNPRKNCIYLSKDLESTYGYDYAFKINTSEINSNLLYVGDFNAVDKIYNHLMGEIKVNKELIKTFINEYLNSFIPFKEYQENKYKYDSEYFPEFMYFGEIEVSEYDLI